MADPADASDARDEVSTATFDNVNIWLKEGSVILIDLRSVDDYLQWHIKGAINIPATELTEEYLSGIIPYRDSRVVMYCDNNFRMSRKVAITTMAYPVFKQLGYKNVYVLQSVVGGKLPMQME